MQVIHDDMGPSPNGAEMKLIAVNVSLPKEVR